MHVRFRIQPWDPVSKCQLLYLFGDCFVLMLAVFITHSLKGHHILTTTETIRPVEVNVFKADPYSLGSVHEREEEVVTDGSLSALYIYTGLLY